MHAGKVHQTHEERPNFFRQLIKSLQELKKIGFRKVSYAPNLGNTFLTHSYRHQKTITH